jgi:nitroreductase
MLVRTGEETAMRTVSRSQDLREVFEEAATAAGFAPSIHNTQPWHWHVHKDALGLYSAPERQLESTDPEGRMMTISCGAALHHAEVALAALGYRVAVAVLPDPQRPTLLARVTVVAHEQPTAEAMRLYQSIAIRHTDRRPVTGEPVPEELLTAVAETVAGPAADETALRGTHLHYMRRDQVIELASAASYAQATENADEALRAELDYWVGGDRPTRLGVPDANLPEHNPSTTVPERDFGRAGTLAVSQEHDRAASYGLLYTSRDDAHGWLAAGRALSAGWLGATELGVSVLPLSAVIEVPTTRMRLREMLTADSYPQIVVRLGNADPQEPGPRPTPRLATRYTIDIESD